jgi:outer membrane receptor protein involved in Fe transport
MPLNDIGYYAAYPSQFIDTENFDEISLAQGTVELDSPVISAAGGLMSMTMLDPSVKPGGLFDVSYGSYSTAREFLRLDSGLIGNSGVRAFGSYSQTNGNNWHGPGHGDRQHVDFKIVKEWGENRIAWSGEWHNAVTPLYPQPTLAGFQQYGANGAPNNYDFNYAPGDTNFYRLYTGTFRLFYTSIPSRLKLADNLTLNVTPYWQYGYGNSPYGGALAQDGNYEGTALVGPLTIPHYAADGGTVNADPTLETPVAVLANFTDLQYRAGLVDKLTYRMGDNSIIVGSWEDYSDETDVQSYSALTPSGEIDGGLWADGRNGFVLLPDGQRYLAGQDHVITQTFEPFIADQLHLLNDRLSFEVGFKYAMVRRRGANGVPGPQDGIEIDNNEPLPRAAVSYRFDPENQIFANISTNFRTPSEQTFFNAYYDGQIYSAANANLKPEYSTSEDLGYRHAGPFLTASVSVFNFYFTNRQEVTVDASDIQKSINVGSQTTYGVDVEAGTRPWRHVSPYVSFEYLHSVEDNNFLFGTSYLQTAGKTSIRSPKVQAALGLTYDDGVFFGNVNVKYVDAQYSTFLDDEGIPAYTTANLGLGVRLPRYGLKAGPELKLNVINLTGQTYLASVASPTATATLSPTYYLAGGRAVVFSLTQAF